MTAVFVSAGDSPQKPGVGTVWHKMSRTMPLSASYLTARTCVPCWRVSAFPVPVEGVGEQLWSAHCVPGTAQGTWPSVSSSHPLPSEAGIVVPSIARFSDQRHKTTSPRSHGLEVSFQASRSRHPEMEIWPSWGRSYPFKILSLKIYIYMLRQKISKPLRPQLPRGDHCCFAHVLPPHTHTHTRTRTRTQAHGELAGFTFSLKKIVHPE